MAKIYKGMLKARTNNCLKLQNTTQISGMGFKITVINMLKDLMGEINEIEMLSS